MEDYANMSDQEINMHVASIIYPESKVIESRTRPPCACITGRIPNCWVDYCNNPADAWPIIISSMISIRPVGNDGQLWEASGMDGMKADYDKNPLRAAMIVFLMMKEGE